MSALRKNIASQVLTFVLVKAADGTALTGATCGGDWVKDGTQAGFAGTFTELSNGQYKYVPTQAETNVTAWGLLITATSAIPVNLTGFTTAADPTDAVRMGLTALPNAAAGASGGLPLSVDTSGRVDVLKINGTSQTARDIGTSVLLSSGTGTGQISLSSGAVTAGTVSDKTGYALTSGERNSIADAMLDRDMSTGTDSGSSTVRTVRQALRFLRNKWAIVTGTLTVYKEDDSTTSWASSVSTTSGADPVTGNDPVGP